MNARSLWERFFGIHHAQVDAKQVELTVFTQTESVVTEEAGHDLVRVAPSSDNSELAWAKKVGETTVNAGNVELWPKETRPP